MEADHPGRRSAPGTRIPGRLAGQPMAGAASIRMADRAGLGASGADRAGARLALGSGAVALHPGQPGRLVALLASAANLVPLQHRALHPRQRVAVPEHGGTGGRAGSRPPGHADQHRAAPGNLHRRRAGAGRALLRLGRGRSVVRPPAPVPLRTAAGSVAAPTTPSGARAELAVSPLATATTASDAHLGADLGAARGLCHRLAGDGRKLRRPGASAHAGDLGTTADAGSRLHSRLRHRLPEPADPQWPGRARRSHDAAVGDHTSGRGRSSRGYCCQAVDGGGGIDWRRCFVAGRY